MASEPGGVVDTLFWVVLVIGIVIGFFLGRWWAERRRALFDMGRTWSNRRQYRGQ